MSFWLLDGSLRAYRTKMKMEMLVRRGSGIYTYHCLLCIHPTVFYSAEYIVVNGHKT